MSRQLVKRPEAERDLLDCADYIALDNPSAALSFLVRARESMEQLLRFPFFGRAAEFKDPAIADLRVRTVKRYRRYLILYRVTPQTIEIVRVIHGARDLVQVLMSDQSE